MIDLESARRMRDKRLRRKLLNTLNLARSHSPGGGLTGRTLRDLVDGSVASGQGFENDEHALALMRDLVNAGYAAEEQLGRRRGQRFGLDYVLYKITGEGTKLWQEAVPPHPLIDDERVPED